MTAQTDSAALLNAQSEKLDAVTTQLAKITVEVQALKDAVGNPDIGSLDPVLAEAITRVVGSVANAATATQVVDDLNVDVPATPA